MNTLDKALCDPQVLARDMVVEIDSPHYGKVKDVGNPVKMSSLDKQILNAPPLLGEHTEMVLKKFLGYSSEKLANLREKNAI